MHLLMTRGVHYLIVISIFGAAVVCTVLVFGQFVTETRWQSLNMESPLCPLADLWYPASIGRPDISIADDGAILSTFPSTGSGLRLTISTTTVAANQALSDFVYSSEVRKTASTLEYPAIVGGLYGLAVAPSSSSGLTFYYAIYHGDEVLRVVTSEPLLRTLEASKREESKASIDAIVAKLVLCEPR